MNKELCIEMEKEGFSKSGLEMSEAFFLFAKNGLGFLTPGNENGEVVVWGRAKGVSTGDIKRLEELGWSHPELEEEEWRENADEYWEEEDTYWSYNCH